jgi:hypothetical protein
MIRPRQCFISYSHDDRQLLEGLVPGLRGLANIYNFSVWHDKRLPGGIHWNPAIRAAMEASDIFLCIVTDRFFGSDYIWEHELPTAKEANKTRGALVIPAVFSGDCWKPYFGSYLQAIPKDQSGRLRPARDWRPTASGFDAINAGVRYAIEDWFGIKPTHDFGGMSATHL